MRKLEKNIKEIKIKFYIYNKAAVIDVTKAGYFKVLGKGRLPN